MGKIIISLFLLSACMTIPVSEPLNFKHRKLVHKRNPALLFDACQKQPGPIQIISDKHPIMFRYDTVVCDRAAFKNNLDTVIRQHYELQEFSNSHQSLVDQSKVHDEADVMRRSIMQNEINRLHWRMAGVSAVSLLVGFLAGFVL